jgi:hypothetical protein
MAQGKVKSLTRSFTCVEFFEPSIRDERVLGLAALSVAPSVSGLIAARGVPAELITAVSLFLVHQTYPKLLLVVFTLGMLRFHQAAWALKVKCTAEDWFDESDQFTQSSCSFDKQIV